VKKSIDFVNLFIVSIGIADNWLFAKHGVFVPTVVTIVLVLTLFVIKYILDKNQGQARN
jgi:hypothetical protein